MIFHKGYTTIDSIIREQIGDEGKNYLHDYVRYLSYALSELRNEMQDVVRDIKTIRADITRRKTLEFPNDYIGYSKVGVQVGDRVIAFVRDGSIAFKQATFDGSKPFARVFNSRPSSVVEFLNYTDSTGNLGSLYGYGYGYNGVGYFDINDRQRELQFSSEVPTNCVYLEYITTGFNPNTETLVSAAQADLVKSGIEKRECKRKFGRNSGEYLQAKRDYAEVYYQLQGRLSDISYEGIIDATTRAYTQSPKMF